MNNLEIILITYNRKEHLQKTFDQIFAENSPIKNLPITILDNKSTDGTSELIQQYAQKLLNIKHIVHNRNIGGNGNIARAYEIAQRKYVWILCDDDEYKWDNWDEVVQAMENDYDAIVVANYENPKKNLANLVKQLTFVPAGIYKTENINSTVMVNAEYNLSNMFAQLALVCHLINENKRFYICENWFVKMIFNACENTYTRGLSSDIHQYCYYMSWPVGFINSVQMILDKKKKNYIIDNTYIKGNNLFTHYWTIFELNESSGAKSIKNLSDVFAGIGFGQKILFIGIGLIFALTAVSLRIKRMDNNKIRFIFLGRLKTDFKIPLITTSNK